jgi:hypothetical protein
MRDACCNTVIPTYTASQRVFISQNKETIQ